MLQSLSLAVARCTPQAVSAAMLAAVAMGSIGTALASGGYYPSTWTVLALAVALLVLGIGAFGAVPRRALGTTNLAAMGLFGFFVLWTAVGVLDAPNASAAWHESVRCAGYFMIFVVTVILATSRLARMTAIGVLALSAGALALYSAWLLASDASTYYLDGRFLGPVGYHNALAATLLVPLLPGVALAARPGCHAVLRGALLVAITASACIAVLSLSRGAGLAMAAVTCLYLAASPMRLRSMLCLALPACAIASGWAELTGPFRVAADDGSIDAATAQVAAHVATWSVVAFVVGVAWALADARFTVPRLATRIVGAIVVGSIVGVAVMGSVRAIDRFGPPSELAAKARTSFTTDPTDAQSSREGISNNGRLPLWKVAIEDYRDEPWTGVGGGNYEPTYYQKRTKVVGFVRQPHNLTLEVLAERGLPALVAFGAFVCCLFVAFVTRLRRASRDQRALATGALAGFLYWLLHAQLEWFWQFSSVTAPALVLAALVAARDFDPQPHDDEASNAMAGWRIRVPLAAIAIATIFAAVPLVFAARFLEQAQAQAPHNYAAALTALDRAASWNPRDPAIEREISALSEQSGDERRAESAARRQVQLDAENWVSHVFAARLYGRLGDKNMSRRFAVAASTLNPLEPSLADPARIGDDAVVFDPLAAQRARDAGGRGD